MPNAEPDAEQLTSSGSLPGKRRPFQCTARNRMVAFFDAQGQRSAQELATLTGVNRGTIHRWRNEPDYQAMVREWQDQIVSELQPLIDSTLNTYAGLVVKAAEEIERKLQAVDATSGLPNEGVRSTALKLLFDSPMVKRLYGLPGKGEGDATTVPQAPVSLHVHLGANGEVLSTGDVTDAEFTEVSDG